MYIDEPRQERLIFQINWSNTHRRFCNAARLVDEYALSRREVAILIEERRPK
jgi:hypothetical protein